MKSRALIALLLASFGGAMWAADAVVPARPKLAVHAFPLSAVRLLDGPFKAAQELDHRVLLDVDADRLLVPFREVAELPVEKARYGGWESRDLNGHSLGHYLSACAQMYAATGDARLKERVDYVVAQLAEIQAANGNGYVAGVPEKLFTDCFAGGPLRGWVPWYNVHKTFAGLIDAHAHTGSAQAIKVASDFAAWAKKGTDAMSDAQFQQMLDIEHGGMNEALADLYAVTGDPAQLALAQRFWHARVLEPLARGEDPLTGLHANTQIPKVVGAARLYELTGDAKYADATRTFWQTVVRRRSYVTGSNSEYEHFYPIGDEAKRLGVESAESCNVYNMLRLTRHLFAWQPDAEQLDFYERALLNHILGTIDPESGMATYFLSLKPGHFKLYGTPDNSWWCCTGTGLENHARYGESIYFHDADALWVNLFIPSEVKWAEQRVTVRQETTFPASDTTTLTIRTDRPVAFALKLRIPGWAKGGVVLKVNGSIQKVDARPQSYLTLQREWRDGDRIELRLPMSLSLHQASDDPETAAILYGPVVLAGALGRETFPQDRQADHLALNFWPTPAVPVFVTDATELQSWIKPVPGESLRFKTIGAGRPRDVELIPLFALHHQRYTVYWKLVGSQRWATMEKGFTAKEAHRRREEARIVDEIHFGEQQAEQEHRVEGEGTEKGNHGSRLYRTAKPGGWFGAVMKAIPDRPMTLRSTFWEGGRDDVEFDIFVNGQKIATQRLRRAHPGQFVDVEYAIPAELTRGKDTLSFRFQARDDTPVGRVYQCQVLKSTL